MTTSSWRLEQRHVELYNLAKHLGERHDLAREKPEQLFEKLTAYLQQVNPVLLKES